MSVLLALVADELAIPVDPRVGAMAEMIADRHPGALGVIFYGSCLRDTTLAGMLDFYLIVDDYARAYGGGWRAMANRLLPPNVFPVAADEIAAKYAVLSLDDLRRETSAGARDPSTYARLAQPCRLVWSASREAGQTIAETIERAIKTVLSFAAPLVPADRRSDPLAIWRTAFANTFRTELRAERGGRSDTIVDADPARYIRIAAAVGDLGGPWSPAQLYAAQVSQSRVERVGKRRQVAKLAKASLTFAGGIDYLAWKVNRHAGTAIEIRPWQRRWPLIAGLLLLPRLLRGGAVR